MCLQEKQYADKPALKIRTEPILFGTVIVVFSDYGDNRILEPVRRVVGVLFDHVAC